MFQFRFEDLMNPMGTYSKLLRCYPVVMMGEKERKDVDRGGKIILPASALDHLTRLRIEFPMLFKLTNSQSKRHTHCGVLEFVADEGRCYLPYWMMRNLKITEGEMLQIEYINLPIARFVKFQPQSVDFLEISNPKAVLENALRNFATLTKGDIISINYNEKDYEMCILETRPGDAVSIIECDMDVDFAPPIGYKEPQKPEPIKPSGDKNLFNKDKLTGTTPNEGYRLDGKMKKTRNANSVSESQATTSTGAQASKTSATSAAIGAAVDTDASAEEHGIPYRDYAVGLLRFNRVFKTNDPKEQTPENESVQPKGYKLKHIGMPQASK